MPREIFSLHRSAHAKYSENNFLAASAPRPCEGREENEYDVLNLWGATLELNPWVAHPCGFFKGGDFRIGRTCSPDEDTHWRTISHLTNYLPARSVPPAR